MAFFIQHALNTPENLCRVRPCQNIPPHLDRLRALGVLPEGDTGHTQDTGLLLDAAGVGQDEASVGLKLQELEEPDGVHDGDPVE